MSTDKHDIDNDRELHHLKHYLYVNGVFTDEELKTLHRVQCETLCEWCKCKDRCVKLECCSKLLCVPCLDCLADSNEEKDILFKCCLCSKSCLNIKYV